MKQLTYEYALENRLLYRGFGEAKGPTGRIFTQCPVTKDMLDDKDYLADFVANRLGKIGAIKLAEAISDGRTYQVTNLGWFIDENNPIDWMYIKNYPKIVSITDVVLSDYNDAAIGEYAALESKDPRVTLLFIEGQPDANGWVEELTFVKKPAGWLRIEKIAPGD